MLVSACEKAEVQTSNNLKQSPIISRGDCDDCPDIDQCCCYVEIDQNDNNNSASIEVCGIDDPLAPMCSGTAGSCLSTSFNPYSLTATLTSPSNPRANFCIELGTAFYVLNTHGTDNASVKVSCQRGQANPQIISYTLTPGGRDIRKAGTGCSLGDCN